MPVQINELVIRANVVQDDGKKGGSSSGGAKASGGGQSDSDKDEIIKECVAIVMELLNNKNQR